MPADPLPGCPDHLRGSARRAWLDFAAGLDGIATSLDAAALELLASSYGLYLDCMAKVATGGPVWLQPGASDKLPVAQDFALRSGCQRGMEASSRNAHRIRHDAQQQVANQREPGRDGRRRL